MDATPTQPALTLTPEDHETFQRVWNRVMPETRPGNPVEVIPAHTYSNQPAVAVMATPEPTESVTPAPTWDVNLSGNEEKQELSITHHGEVLPEIHSFLGESSLKYGAELQQFVTQALQDYKTYYALARKTSGSHSRTLSDLSATHYRHGKRLSTAYFLLSGVRFFPESQVKGQMEGSFLNTLRRQFLREQEHSAHYRHAQANTHDLYLKDLYSNLTADCDSHIWLLRDMLEVM